MSEAGWSARTSRPREPPLVEHRLEFPGRLAGAEALAGPAGRAEFGRACRRVHAGASRSAGRWASGAMASVRLPCPGRRTQTDPPSAGPGHRARVQCVGREFAGHQDAIVEEVCLKPDLRDHVPEHLPRNCGARRIGWQRPRVTRSRVHAPQAVDALLPHTWCLRLTRHKAVGRRGAVGSNSVFNIRGFRLLICETQITTHLPRFAISLASLTSSQFYTEVPHGTENGFSDIWRKLPRTSAGILLTLSSGAHPC